MVAESLVAATPLGDVHADILAAAHQRFLRFGYTKTTMAEIAADCDMSAANLYRYFANKQDIAAHLARRCLDSEVRQLAAVVQRADLSAAQRIEAFVLETLRTTHERSRDSPFINQMVEAIARERREVIDEHNHVRLTLLRQLLDQGDASGEFQVADSHRTAQAMLATMVLFDVPLFMQVYPLSELERLARLVSELLVKSLRNFATQA